MTDVIHSDKKEVQETPAPTSPIGDLTATDDAPHLPSYDPHSEKPGIFQTLHFSENKSAVIVEFIGTFLFTLTIPLAGINDNETAPIAIGFMYMALVFSFAYLSGAHMNPAISLACFLASEFPIWKLILYSIAQVGGSFAAAFYCIMIHGADFPVPDAGLNFLTMIRFFLHEAVYTFVICSVVLHLCWSKRSKKGTRDASNYFGFAVGFAVLISYLCVGSVNNGAFNPAVATGLIVARCFTTYCVPMASLWMFWASELGGAVVAAIFFLALESIPEDELEL